MKKLKGLPAYYGKAQGVIVFVKNQSDLKKVTPTSIVVTNKITSEYTSAFLTAAGVISQTGGVTCHAAIVCREQATPCVVSVANCFSEFKEGVRIELDTKTLSYNLI